MKKRIILISIILLFNVTPLHAIITDVTLNSASPTTLSNGNPYYLSGVDYSFNVLALDTAAGAGDWQTVQLTFPSGESITVDINTLSATVESGVEFISALDNTIVPTNLNFTINLRFVWNSGQYAAGNNSITATVTNANGPNPPLDEDTDTFLFGRSSSIRVLNFAQDGVAADTYINQYHTDFHVTGTIVYNVTGSTVTNTVDSIDDGEIVNSNQIALLLDTTSTSSNAGTDEEDFDFTISSGDVPPQAAAYAWWARVTMATGGVNVTSANNIPITCNNVQITSITFSGGGGIDTPYYRSVNVPNTQAVVNAVLQYGGGSMVGNTTIRIRDVVNPTDYYDVQILNGDNQGIANVSYPVVAQTPLGETTPRSYEVNAVFGSAFDDEQNIDINPGSISQPANPAVYWDRNDPPGNNDEPSIGQTPFTTWVSSSQTASSFTLNWTPLTTGGPNYDADFYTYRIYYKATNDSDWLIVDRSSAGYGLGGTGDTYRLDLITTGTATITGLQPFTQYDYIITAVDVFGQEVEHPIPSGSVSDALYYGSPSTLGYGQIATYPAGIEATITDGITTYTDSQFEIPPAANPVASNRPLRRSAVKVSLYIVTTGDQPDSVNLILAQDDGTGSAGSDLVSGGGLVPTSTVLYERIACSKTAPNTWTTQISSENQFFNFGSSCRFIVESIKNNTPSYSDCNSETETIATANPNDYEYTFAITRPVNFQPWPVRILNNVITDENPVAYPSYYLSDDAVVTITVYDIKGRPVATLMDKAFRRGGQNIKENGWRGINKARKKLGVGLYYIHIRAKRVRDGRIILNEAKKVVIAK